MVETRDKIGISPNGRRGGRQFTTRPEDFRVMRPDLFQKAQEHAPLTVPERQEQMRVFTARYLWHIAKGVPMPDELTEGINEAALVDELGHMHLPIPAAYKTKLETLAHKKQVPEDDDEYNFWKRQAKKLLVEVFPELPDLSLFDQGTRVKGDRKADLKVRENIFVRMAEVMMGRKAWGLVGFDFELADIVQRGLIPRDAFEEWQKVTRLKNFRMRVIVPKEQLDKNEGSLAETLQQVDIILKGEMGIISTLETIEQIPAAHLNKCQEDGIQAIFATYDVPGMYKSAFRNPGEIDTDKYLATVQAHNFAVWATLHLLGFDNPEIDRKAQLTYGHSKEAVAIFYQGDDLFRPDRGYIPIGAVPQHGFFQSIVAWVGIGIGSRLASMSRMTEDIAQRSGVKRLLKWFIRSGSRDVRDLHRIAYEETDKRVISRMMLRLLDTPIPEYSRKIPDTLQAFISLYDFFTQTDNVGDQILRVVSDPGSVTLIRHGHYGQSYVEEVDRMVGTKRQNQEHLNYRDVIVLKGMDLTRRLIKAARKSK